MEEEVGVMNEANEVANHLELTSPCTHVVGGKVCGGTMVPRNSDVSWDWDGTAIVGTECSRGCGMQSFESFTWDAPEHEEDSDA